MVTRTFVRDLFILYVLNETLGLTIFLARISGTGIVHLLKSMDILLKLWGSQLLDLVKLFFLHIYDSGTYLIGFS